MAEPSRRDFLKLAGIGAVAVAAGKTFEDLSKDESDMDNLRLEISPTITNGVEVYGLKEKILTEKDVIGFYAFLDKKV
ncbi:MAG TPA: twin-arginine translocation signal domain-containing protein [Patescibacteria group bacterium]|nr:twin-arginine translocation signal domain-containing protein [Patescibacteria group bacterium]